MDRKTVLGGAAVALLTAVAFFSPGSSLGTALPLCWSPAASLPGTFPIGSSPGTTWASRPRGREAAPPPLARSRGAKPDEEAIEPSMSHPNLLGDRPCCRLEAGQGGERDDGEQGGGAGQARRGGRDGGEARAGGRAQAGDGLLGTAPLSKGTGGLLWRHPAPQAALPQRLLAEKRPAIHGHVLSAPMHERALAVYPRRRVLQSAAAHGEVCSQESSFMIE